MLSLITVMCIESDGSKYVDIFKNKDINTAPTLYERDLKRIYA